MEVLVVIIVKVVMGSWRQMARSIVGLHVNSWVWIQL